MSEFERRKQDAETVEIVSEVVVDDKARRQRQQEDAARAERSDAHPQGDAFRGGSGGAFGGGFGGGTGGNAHPPFDEMPAAGDVETIRTLSHILYGLYVIGLFTTGVGGLIGVIIDYIRRPSMRGTFYASHSTWRTRTFWWSLVGYLIALPLFWTPLGAGFLVVVSIWYIYRCAKGWLRLLEGKPMNGGWF